MREQRPRDSVGTAHRAGSQPSRQLVQEALQVARCDIGDPVVTELRHDVDPEVVLVGRQGVLPLAGIRGNPLRTELGDCHAPALRVNPHPTPNVGLDDSEKREGVCLGYEGRRSHVVQPSVPVSGLPSPRRELPKRSEVPTTSCHANASSVAYVLDPTAQRLTAFNGVPQPDTRRAQSRPTFERRRRVSRTIIVAVAQWERRAIAVRTREALTAKRAQGVQLGRPSVLSPEIVARIVEAHQTGAGWSTIARQLTRKASLRPTAERIGIRAP